MLFKKFRYFTNYINQKIIKNRDTFQNLNSLRQTQWLSRKELKKYQWKKITSLLKYSKNNVPYYRKILKEIDLDNLNRKKFKDIPFLDKNKIRNNFESLISEKYSENDLINDSTSGSTGEKLRFFKDKKSKGWKTAIKYRNIEWTGIDIWDKKANLWGLHSDNSKSDNLRSKISHWMNNLLFLSAHDLTEESMKEYKRKINKFKPKLIISQPSVMYTFSNFIENLDSHIYEPEGIILSAETLYPYQRKKIKSVFNCEIFNRYGSREFGDMAQECEQHEGLHIYSERVYLEIINEDGEPCEPGEMGEIVVTDLDNYGFPFIRYKIEDVGIKSDKTCSCGRGLPLLESLEGRTFDIIVCPNGNHLSGTFWTILLREKVNGIEDFKLIQEQEDKIELKFVTNNEFDKAEKKKLLNIISDKCGEQMQVELIKVNALEKTKSGKKRFIISEVNPFE